MTMLAEVPFLAETNWVDLVALGVVLVFFVWGAVRGFLLQLAGLAVLVGSILLASVISVPLGRWIHGRWPSLEMISAKWICFVLFFLCFLFLGMAIARRIRGALEKAKVLAYDRLLGGLLGGVKGLLVVIVVVYGLRALLLERGAPPKGLSADLERSRTMQVARWSKEKVLVFLPRGARSWVRQHTDPVDRRPPG